MNTPDENLKALCVMLGAVRASRNALTATPFVSGHEDSEIQDFKDTIEEIDEQLRKLTGKIARKVGL